MIEMFQLTVELLVCCELKYVDDYVWFNFMAEEPMIGEQNP